MSRKPATIAQVILPVPLRHHFDYRIGAGIDPDSLLPGMRVLVPFGRHKQRTAILTGTTTSSTLAPDKLKPLTGLIDETPLFDPDHLALLEWAANYYHHPLGDAVFSTLPVPLRQGKPAQARVSIVWQPTPAAHAYTLANLGRATRQKTLLERLLNAPGPVDEETLNRETPGWRTPMQALSGRGLVLCTHITPVPPVMNGNTVVLNPAQQAALDTITGPCESGQARYLLDGVTGSGKTEVYIEAVRRTIASGKQALLMVPEIGLTPHFISRFSDRLGTPPVVLHSGLSDTERLQAWLAARDGVAQVILGTRSAIWTPLRAPGLFIVDEEHDTSYKQQDGFRYSARDIAIMRADRAGVPVVLGSATPALETLHNVETGKFSRLRLPERAGNARLPDYRIIDLRVEPMTGALSGTLLRAIDATLARRQQVLLFLNRRGYSPVLMCHHCGWIQKCRRCDIPYTFHKHQHRLVCHHCGIQTRPAELCEECGEKDIIRIGHGTERLTETLQEAFPDARILRIDRDSTRRKGAMGDYNDRIISGEVDILVGTQMLAKGHHFPQVTLAGIIDADRGLYSADFRASERMAQQIVQVSGRAGRGDIPGTVMIQTHFPTHPLIRRLADHDYEALAAIVLDERRQAMLPPWSYQAMLRAEATDERSPMTFLKTAAGLLNGAGVDIYGPFPAPIEKRAGRFRFQLILQSARRSALHGLLRNRLPDLDALPQGRQVRWSIDIDPQELL